LSKANVPGKNGRAERKEKRLPDMSSLFGMAESFENYNTSSFAVVVEEAVVTFTV
jgi:hypothetical protein